MKARDLALLVFLAAVQVVAVTLFTRGFFLTRSELEAASECASLPFCTVHLGEDGEKARKGECVDVPPVFGGLAPGGGAAGCWAGRKFARVVLVVIDALRYDFVEHWPSSETSVENAEHGSREEDPLGAHAEGERSSSRGVREGYFVNQLPVIHEALTNSSLSQQSLLFRLESDSPTVTMQRLKALVTGGIPTFVDMNDVNFESSAITEDNIIAQLKSQSARLAFLGDDTWTQLFPSSFDLVRDFPSFNAKDLHTVDNGVIEHLLPQVRSQQWDLLVAHFLGVDHVGHRYGPSHPAMEEKLTQMDGVLRELVAEMDEDSLLLVLGDHGMTEEGNHGGATANETYTALFAHSGRQLAQGRRVDPYATHADRVDTYAQIDVVPTISLLLGIPVPYGNLGAVLPDLLAPGGLRLCSAMTHDEADVRGLVEIAWAHFLNAWQVYRYLDTYAQVSAQFSATHSEEMRATLLRGHAMLAGISDMDVEALRKGIASEDALERLCAASELHADLLHGTVDMCREQWAQFNLLYMAVGTALFLGVFFGMCLHVTFVRGHALLPFTRILVGVVVGAAAGALLGPPGDLLLLLGAGVMGGVGAWLVSLVLFATSSASPRLLILDTRTCLSAWGVLLLGFHGYCLFTNSFIEMQERIVQYLLCSTVAVYLLAAVHHRSCRVTHVAVAAVAVVCIRYSALFGQGRHEVYASFESTLELAAHFAWVLTAALGPTSLGLLLCFKTRAKAETKWQEGLEQLHALLCCVGVAGVAWYWAVRSGDSFEHLPIWQKNLIPRIVYAATTLNILLVFGGSLKTRWSQRQVCLLMVTAVVGALGLILGQNSAMALLLMAVECLSLLYLHVEALGCVGGGGRTSALAAVVWALVTLQFFFATGHHWQFSSLQFESAYIGFEDFNFAAGAAIVLCNTFAAVILAVVTLPFVAGADQGHIQRKSAGVEAAPSLPLSYLLFFCEDIALTAVFVCVERRHLMVWRVFAPKFVFSALLLLVLAVLTIAWHGFLILRQRGAATGREKVQ